MNVFITGGAGFLGMHLARFFSAKKYTLTLGDIQSFDPNEYTGKYRTLKCDIRDSKSVWEATQKNDFVIHAAAALPLRSAQEIHEVNVQGTRNVLDAALRANIKRVIYISSTAVYGVPKKHPIVESDPMVGVGPYGHSKIDAEHVCQEYMSRGLPITIIRPKTFVGTGRLGVFEILFDWIHDGKKIPVIGSGNNLYQLLDVDDLVQAVWLFTQKNDSKYSDTFNIGAKDFGTVREDLEMVFSYAKSGSRILPTPAYPIKSALWFFEKVHVSPLYQWVYDTADKDSFVSIDKLNRILKWHPKYSNSQALIKAFQWYQEHYIEVKSRTSGTTHTVGWKQGVLRVFKQFL